MAGLCAALTHAPVTAVVLVFELTGHYELTLPIMLCSITASIVARMIDADSYYTNALRQKGEELPTGVEELALKTTYVRDVMRHDLVTVRDVAGFDEVMDKLANHRGDTIYVVDEAASLVGRIQLQDVKNFINDPTLGSVVIAADLTRPAAVATREDSLAAILPLFDDPELGEIAVIESKQRRRLLGRVRHQDVIAGFRSEVLGQQLRARFRESTGRKSGIVDLPPGWELAPITVPDEWSGLAIEGLPDEVLRWLIPVLVVRPDGSGGQERVPAAPELVLQGGHELLALCRRADLEQFRRDGQPESE
jgi:CIC family chloride channel protein